MNENNNPYKFSEDFKQVLIKSSEGFLSGDDFDKLFEQFETKGNKFHFTPSSEANLIRIINSLLDKKTFLLDAIRYDHHTEILCAISSFSNYLTDIVVRNPEYLYQLFDQQYLTSKINSENMFDEITRSISSFKKLESKTRLLRNYKRKYLLKIGVGDILGFKNLTEITAELSILAKIVARVLFKTCFGAIQQKYNVEVEENYTLCSLGKLGGGELNYSSDIDLILFYKENYLIEKINKEYHEIISEAVQLFIKEATMITEAGYLYRVDFRLRPDGRNSLLTRTLSDYLKYYETRGEEWERQMLIKLGYVCGDSELFETFKNFLTGFIFPRTFSSSITDTINKMKQSIENRSANENNIKLSPGGIRDIEFGIQALQLLNGGRKINLRTGNSLDAIEQLQNEKLLSEKEADLLQKAYMFFRNIEHFVQLMNDKQTHSLPQSVEMRQKLSRYLGYESYDSFETSLSEIKSEVRNIYNDIIKSNSDEIDDTFDQIEFLDQGRATKNYNYLSKGVSLFGEKQFDAKTKETFTNFEEDFVEYLKDSSHPDQVLDNFARVIKNVTFPSVWYSAFEDKLFLQSFLKICQFSQRAVDLMTTSPRLGDSLLSKRVFQKQTDLNIEEELFSLAVQHSVGSVEYPEFSNRLVSTVAKIIEKVAAKHKLNYSYFLAGLGSFGNEELSFGSDIDLIVVVDDLNRIDNAEKDFQNILSELQKEIPQFEIDFRLRPEGRNSPLVTDLSAYAKYIEERMRTWEFQALTKCRFITGDQKLYENFIHKVISGAKKIDRENSAKEIFSMYRSKLNLGMGSTQKINLKSNPGALLTIDTIIQLAMQQDHSFYENSFVLSSIEKFRLSGKELTTNNDIYFVDDYIWLKNAQIALQNCFNQKKSTMPDNKYKVDNLAAYMGFSNNQEFIERIQSIFNRNNKLINNLKNKWQL